MAYETGTVADLEELIDAIRNFVTTDADLISDGQEWTELSYVASGANGVIGQTYFNAPGLDGTEEIVIGMRPWRFADADTYSIGWHMAQDWDGSLGFLYQPGASSEKFTPTSDSAMEYWLVANGRRLIGVVKISTVYTSFYIGKILPWGSTGDYPLPFLVGANTNSASALRWSSEAWELRSFVDPGHLSSEILKPNLVWETVNNYPGTDTAPPSLSVCTLPYNSYVSGSYSGIYSTEARDLYRTLRDNIDGTYALIPIVLHSNGTDNEIFGELDGCFAVSGFDNFAENIITVDAVDYLVVPSVGRSGRADYFALRLE